jgi:anti-anti-sigma factor
MTHTVPEGGDGVRGFSMTVEQQTPDIFRVGLGGELDVHKAYTMDEELRSIERREPSVIVLDLRELRFLDSSGLARILAAQRRAAKGQWRFAVVRGCATVQRILALAALDRSLDLIDDPADVLPVRA